MLNRLLNTGVIDNPRFTILSNGTELSYDFVVHSISISKSVNKIPTAQLVLKDGDIPNEDFPTSNREEFVPGAEIEIQMGYRDEQETVFSGIVIKHGIKSQYKASSQLTVELKDPAIKMTVGRKNKYFKELTDSDIIQEIIGEYGLSADVETTSVTHAEMVQYHCTDWDFMVTRAEANGKLVFVDDGTISVKAPSLAGEPVAELVYGQNINEFDAEMDARDQFGGITSKSWDFAQQSVIESEATDPGLPEQGNVNASDLASVIGLDQLPYQHSGKVEGEEMQSWVDARFLRSRLAKIRGRIRILGLSKIKPGDVVELGGLGERFNGVAFVSAVGHYYGLDSSWYTDIQIGLSPEWLIELYNNVMEKPSSGLLPGIHGLQVGVVTAIHDDPDGEDRVQVRVPIIDPEDSGIWARVATLDAGDSRGTFFRPEVEDEVIVGFINDDPRDAVVLGMMNSSAKPAPITATEENNEKGIITRDELKLLFDDDKKSVTIETPNGNKVVISDDEGSISLTDENGNEVVMDSSAISLESVGDITIKASGDITIEGNNINQKANMQFKAEGASGAELSSSASAVIKGSIVQIN
ncbi:type VI secretion system tip protein VgrG [Aliifodinibius sp. S!AR15-10]|uniref:type VI secretion system tip protein VgrG n=1 Tax=Aliifodinibius sp. S!AR15-10 TaxID=2950437 RepID=UPI002856ACA6|nr:type VI secretion system tip protein VgrG [Aliifodinibius sp. S!AR15-10]MDR8390614.1 type VI secretion system tip protein VgrG [Aliifodinibius sp. S!AR15-10]